jgi:hypothetical protein
VPHRITLKYEIISLRQILLSCMSYTIGHKKDLGERLEEVPQGQYLVFYLACFVILKGRIPGFIAPKKKGRQSRMERETQEAASWKAKPLSLNGDGQHKP